MGHLQGVQLSPDAEVVLRAFLSHIEKIDVCLELQDVVQSVPKTVKVLVSLKELEQAGVISTTNQEANTGSGQVLWFMRDLGLAEALLGGFAPLPIGPRLRPSALSQRLVAV